MSDIRIKLTKEEKEEFALLTKEEQNQFMETASKRRQQLMVKTIVLTTILIESFDDLIEFDSFRHKLKNLANNYSKELNKYIDDVFDINEERGLSTDYIAKITAEIDKLL